MSNTSTPLPKDSPIIIAWENFKQTDDYQNSKRLASNEKHVEGSLWHMFLMGWEAHHNHENSTPDKAERG